MPSWLTTLIADAKTYGPEFLIPAGSVIALAVAVLTLRALRRAKPDKVAVNVAVLLASAFSAQGMYEVATKRLGLPWYLAAGLFAVAEMAMLASAVRAHRHYEATSTKGQPGNLGPHQRFVWVIAACAGMIVSLNAHSPSEYFLRLLMPLLVAGLWRMGYVSPVARKRAADAITMRWSLRRLGVAFGVIEPGERDLATINADRQRRQMIAHAHAFHRGSLLLGWWHAARLRRLALDADEPLIELVQTSVDRVHRIEALTAPASTGAALDGHWWLHPWRTARKVAVLVEQARAELSAETARLTEQIRERTENLSAANERAEAADRLREQTVQNLRTEADRDLSIAVQTARAEGERAARTEAEQTIERLRAEIRELNDDRANRVTVRRSGQIPARSNPQVVAAMVGDEQVIEKLSGPFSALAEQTGQTPSRYWVEQNGPCKSRQAGRVLDVLTDRLRGQAGQNREQADGQVGEQNSGQVDDPDRELAAMTGQTA